VNARSSALAVGTTVIGDDLTVRRLGFGAMRITGKDIWGDPPDRSQAIETLRLVRQSSGPCIATARRST
jgi:aryl-alcohol dehydrogenase-like predicted oxidoreductase